MTKSRTTPRLFLFWNALTLTSFLIALFFLLTNGIPLIQWGILREFGKKMRYVRTMQISVSIFFAMAAILFWKMRTVFNELTLVRGVRRLTQISMALWSGALFAFYAAIQIVVGFMRHAALETRAFDLGIFAQAIWNTTRGHFLYSSLKEGICLLGDHVSPILLALAPAYALWPDPRILLIFQALASAACVILIARIARDKTSDPTLALAFGLLYWFYAPSRSALHEDFHPELLVEPFLLAAFFLMEKKRLIPFLLSVLIVMTGKENMLGVTFMLGAYAWWFQGWPGVGIGLMVFSAGVFFTEIHWFVPWLTGKPYYYQGFYQGLALGSAPIGPLFSRTAFVGVAYFLKIFAPFLFLPLFHLPSFLLTLPILFQNILSKNPVMRSFGYHYTAGLTPFVFVSSILGLQTLCRKYPALASRTTQIAAVLLFVGLMNSGPSEYYYFWQSHNHASAHRRMVRTKLQEIPERFSVLTHNNLIPQLANRKEIYQFDYHAMPTKGESARKRNADFVILEPEFWEPETASPEAARAELLKQGYRKEFEQDGFIIFQKSRA